MRLRILAMPVLAAGLLTGCNHGPVQTGIAGSQDPYGSARSAAVCQTTAPKLGADGVYTSAMTVRSDDGRCVLTVASPDSVPYASFGLSPAPEHGKTFMYVLDGKVRIAYTPTMGYAGTDTFTATLIRGPGQKRDQLKVDATVDATGVVMPKPAVTAPAAASSTKTKAKAKTPARRRTATRRR